MPEPRARGKTRPEEEKMPMCKIKQFYTYVLIYAFKCASFALVCPLVDLALAALERYAICKESSTK